MDEANLKQLRMRIEFEDTLRKANTIYENKIEKEKLYNRKIIEETKLKQWVNKFIDYKHNFSIFLFLKLNAKLKA